MNQTLIRSILKIGGGALLTKGLADESTLETIIAGLTALIGVVWGIYHRSEGKIANPVPAFVLFASLLFLPQIGTAAQPPVSQPSTPQLSTSAKDTIVLNDQLFRAGEVSLDVGTAFATQDLDTFQSSTAIAANWFVTRGVGFFLEGRTESLTHSTVDDAAFGLLGRLPLETLHLAPHFKLGGDYDFERNEWEAFAAVGAELRLTRHVGFVGEVRGVRPVHDASKEHLQFVVSLRGTL